MSTDTFNPDRCFVCLELFKYNNKEMPFYTVLINSKIRRVCPDCFSKYLNKWLG